MIGRLFETEEVPPKISGHGILDNERASGSLYVTPDAAEGSHDQHCIYMCCEAFVRPASARFSFELVVVRTDDDPDADANATSSTTATDAASESATPSAMYFPIDKSSRFDNEGDRFGWSDRAAKRYSLDVDSEVLSAPLRRAISIALFQSIHSALPGPDDQQTLDEILTKPPPPTTDDLLESKGELMRVKGEFCKFLPLEGEFEILFPSVIVTIRSATIREDQLRGYVMSIYHPQSGTHIIEFEISNALNVQFFTETSRLIWTAYTDDDDKKDDGDDGDDVDGDANSDKNLICLSLHFEDPNEFVRFRNQFSVCMYEATHQASIEDLKLKDDAVEYIQNSLRDDFEPMDIDEGYETAEDEVADERRLVTDAPGNAEVDRNDDGMENSQLAVATNHDRTFVVRGNRMGVFQTGDDGVELKTTIAFKNPRGGGSFTPSKVLLHQKDRSMLLLDPSDDSRIMRMDLERGEIVDTWDGGLTANTPVKAVHQSSKYSNLTDEQEFVGLNKNQLLRMDPRTSEFIVQSKKYASGTRAKLDCLATTGSGYVAVASENGDIRLYDQIGKNAKTHLPGLGDPIVGIDVSEDGNFILATTRKYLLLIDTRVKGQAKGGFEKSMGKKKPVPHKLTINNEDIVKHRMGEVNFTTAHFNTGTSMERSIVTSTGPFIVLWNFRQVKSGKTDNYTIKRYEDNVVADNFTYNDDGKIVVTLPNNVAVAKR